MDAVTLWLQISIFSVITYLNEAVTETKILTLTEPKYLTLYSAEA